MRVRVRTYVCCVCVSVCVRVYAVCVCVRVRVYAVCVCVCVCYIENAVYCFIAFSITFSSAILGVVPEWGMINVLTSDGRITHLKEHDTQSKLESLFKRNLFDYAVKCVPH